MASSISNITFVSAGKVQEGHDGSYHYSDVMKVIFSLISIGSIIPNLLFLIAMLLNYSRMRSGYHNILLYNMMISDMLAGNATFFLNMCFNIGVQTCSNEATMLVQHGATITLLDATCWPRLNTTLDDVIRR